MIEGVAHSFGDGATAQEALELWTLIQVEPRGPADVVIVGLQDGGDR